MNNNEKFDFSTTEPVKSAQYLQPGFYNLSISEAKYVQPDGFKQDGVSPKTPYLEFTFEGKSGTLTSKFYVTPKTIDRLQYLFMGWFGKKADKKFESAEQVGAFFEKVFNSAQSKAITKLVVVGGNKIADGRVFGEIPYADFIVDGKGSEQEGPFEVDKLNWLRYVRTTSNPSTGTDNAFINDVPNSGSDNNNLPEDDLGLPF